MRSRLWTVLACSGLLFWASCGGGSGSSSSSGTTQLRFVQASPDAPEVNLLIDGKTVATNLLYSNSTDYIAVKSGSRHVQMQPVNTNSTLLAQSVPVTSGSSETLFVTGPVAGLKPFTLTDGATTSVSNDGYVRVVNASTAMGAADVYIVGAGTALSGTPTVPAVGFDGDTGYQLEAAGSYAVFMTVPGTTRVLLSIGPINMSASQNQTVIVLDASTGGFTYIVLMDQ